MKIFPNLSQKNEIWNVLLKICYELQIPVTAGEFELQTPYTQCSCLIY